MKMFTFKPWNKKCIRTLQYFRKKQWSRYTEASCIKSSGCSWSAVTAGWKRRLGMMARHTESSFTTLVLERRHRGTVCGGTGTTADSQVRPWLCWCLLTSHGQSGLSSDRIPGHGTDKRTGRCNRWALLRVTCRTQVLLQLLAWPWNAHSCSCPLWQPETHMYAHLILPQYNSLAPSTLICDALFVLRAEYKKNGLLDRNFDLQGLVTRGTPCSRCYNEAPGWEGSLRPL